MYHPQQLPWEVKGGGGMGCVFSCPTDGWGRRDCSLSIHSTSIHSFQPMDAHTGRRQHASCLKWLNIYKEMSRAYQASFSKHLPAPSVESSRAEGTEVSWASSGRALAAVGSRRKTQMYMRGGRSGPREPPLTSRDAKTT